MGIGPIHLDLVYDPLLPDDDNERVNPFKDEDYRVAFGDDFLDVVKELTDLSVRLLTLMPDPSLSPNERLERLARVVPNSQLITAHRRSARSKLYEIRRRLDELVPGDELTYREKLEALVTRLDELVPGALRPIQKLERLGDYRSTDVGVSPRSWQ
ncbi:hypothetical protein ACTMTU_20115 [Streptomyces sp. OZ13]|uniref:hypothetical protein n=1 Tax=Streptomyces sp. OZ13 TaxID=3452210 RepID=UPI003F8B4A16